MKEKENKIMIADSLIGPVAVNCLRNEDGSIEIYPSSDAALEALSKRGHKAV